MRKRIMKIMMFIFAMFMEFDHLGLESFAAEQNAPYAFNVLESKSVIGGEQKIIEENEYKVIYTLYDSWMDGYNLGIEIVNTGKATISDWEARIPFSAEINNIWGAEVLYNKDGVLEIKSLNWNSEIYPGQSINIGFIAKGMFEAYPNDFCFVENSEEIHCGFEVSVTTPQIWGEGFNGFLEVTNSTDMYYENWRMVFKYNNEITTLWNARIVEHNGNEYTIEPYTSDRFDINQTLLFGFQVNNGNPDAVVSDVKVITKSCQGTGSISDEKIDDENESEVQWDTFGSYYKDIDENNIAYDEEDNVRYAKNQIIIGVKLGVDKSIIEDIAANYGAIIIGYLCKMETYQLEFIEDKSYSELLDIINKLKGCSIINYAILNYVDSIQQTYYPTEGYTDAWDVIKPEGQQWGLEALRLPRAWNYKDEYKGSVKVGVYDSSFYDSHLDVKFKKIINNTMIVGSDGAHGTHVAGTIGAIFDNKIGISGVATDVELYGYCRSSIVSQIGKEIGSFSSFFKECVILEELICNNVRVINISQGYSSEDIYGASTGNQKVIKRLEEKSNMLSANLQNLILEGFDFLIVNAAGNSSDKLFDENFIEVSNALDAKYYLPVQDALYNYYPTAITEPIIKDRIIVVGAAERLIDSSGSISYKVTDWSARGDRVDIYAPGANIYSTVPESYNSSGYGYMSGTSMAAPHITGLAALIWQANPNLTASQVKEIIVKSKGHSVEDLNDKTKKSYMPDAEECIKIALSKPGGINIEDNDMPRGTIKGKVVDTKGNPIPDIVMYFVRTSANQANLKDYYYVTTTNSSGEYEFEVASGTYELTVCDKTARLLPMCYRNIVVVPDDIKYLENIILERITDDYIKNIVKISGTVFNAINGNPIYNAEIHVRRDWNNTNGWYFDPKTKTDTNGDFDLNVEYLGNYTIEVKADGYITGYFNVTGILDETGIRQSMVLTPVLSEGEYRVVLTWDDDPQDLDAHLTYYQGTSQIFHVYFGMLTGNIDGIHTSARLDYDNTSGYGPETITLTVSAKDLESDGCFYYSVHKFSGNEELYQSNAIVRVYSGNDLINTYHVPFIKGNDWRVFKINKNGIVNINTIITVGSAYDIT